MEQRKITVISTRSQSTREISTDASTLGELKTVLNSHNIDYSGLSFYEGRSKTELLSDASLLPHDIPFKGEVTNELVILLTVPNKKIKSGNLTRAEVYEIIKSNNAQESVKVMLGKNFTNCSTEELVNFINSYILPTKEESDSIELDEQISVYEASETARYLVSVINSLPKRDVDYIRNNLALLDKAGIPGEYSEMFDFIY